MYGYERSYKTGRAVTSWLEFVGWLIVVLGVIVALAGFASGGFMGMASRNFGGSSTPFILRIVAMVPGVLVAAGGLMSIMLAQHTKATIDTSEMTRELLAIAKGEPAPTSVEKPTLSTGTAGQAQRNDEGNVDQFGFDEDGKLEYRGVIIQKVDNKYQVGNQKFSTFGKAKRYISDQA